MFDSLKDLSSKLAATGYFIDPVMTQVVFLAAKLQKPLLLEGPAGSGKTQLALSVAAAGNTHVERLQCYRGVSEDKAIGRFDEGLQRLDMEFSKGQHENWQTVQANLKGRDFFRPGPMMRALECDRPCVLLIDELDKVDDGFEAVFLEHTYRWLAMEGVLVLVIPFERLHECSGLLSSHFSRLAAFRMTDPDSVQYRQIAVLGLRRDVRGAAVESNKRQLLSLGLYGSFLGLPELQPGACPSYPVPQSGAAELSYRGLPYDLLEDLLPQSSAWKQVAPLVMPHQDVATGRPITPLHGGHVGLLCTAGLLNGIFGQGEDRHIARWRSVKHVTTFVEQDGDAEIIHHRERWANELYLVYADGRTLKLTETPAKKEGETDGECTPAARAA
jgi:hypothetical protein